MYGKSLIITAIAYESGKRETLARLNIACDRTIAQIEEWVDAYDKKHAVATPCTGNILCERQGRRHKDGCIGRTEPFSVYADGLRSLN